MAGSAVTFVRPQTHQPYTSRHAAVETSHRTHGFLLTASATSAAIPDETETPVRTNPTTPTTSVHSLEEHQQCQDDVMTLPRRPRSGSEGLDFLAALAEQERDALRRAEAATELMPPPRPRRPRSVSNPDDMLRYESTSCSMPSRGRHRRCLVLPASILEEELAEASEAVRQDSIIASTSDSETILMNARARILEDVLEESAGEKGDTILPHTLTKYKELYNRCGRIGVYTKAERAAILARFHGKRTRRNWQKKIRYNCRKSLADSRLRVKGRFVKREEEQEQLLRRAGDDDDDDCMPDVNDPEAGFCPTEDQPYRRLRRHTVT